MRSTSCSAMRHQRTAAWITVLLLAPLAGCSALFTPPVQQQLYLLDGMAPHAGEAQTGAPQSATFIQRGPMFVVNPPHAAAGFDSPHILYLQAAHQLAYYANSDWVDTPARMLAPLVRAAVADNTGDAVAAPSAVAADIWVDTEIEQLLQDFRLHPSQVRFTLRVYFVDYASRRVLAARTFDIGVNALSDDVAGGVAAANSAVRQALDGLPELQREAVARWRESQRNAAAKAAQAPVIPAP